MSLSPGLVSHTLALLVYGVITLFIARGYLRRNLDRAMLLASGLTTAWLAVLCAQYIWQQPPFFVRLGVEVIKTAAWISVLFFLIGSRPLKLSSRLRSTDYLLIATITLVAFLLVIAFIRAFFDITLISGKLLLVSQLGLQLLGLIILEQTWKSASEYNRSALRYLCIGIGALFIYDFFLYSDALLFNRINTALWNARGMAFALVAPLFAITLANHQRAPINVQFSRQFVFHSTTLILAGTYLLLMALGGYYLQLFGGKWGDALQVLFLFAALLLLVLIISSNRLRARLNVFITQHFLNYQYDYRTEWLNNTRVLTDMDQADSLGTRLIYSLAAAVKSQRGVLWIEDEQGDYQIMAHLNLQEFKHGQIEKNAELIDYFKSEDWIVNLQEYASDPTIYHLIEIPDPIQNVSDPWLIVPLCLPQRLLGFVLLCEPITPLKLNWENFDLLKVIAAQGSSFLAQQLAQEKLHEAKQFEAVNRMSAFLVHDLKTVIAQLSLLVKNANKHKTNPAFIEDMIATTDHAVQKMSSLVQQIKQPAMEKRQEAVDLLSVLKKVKARQGSGEPTPSFRMPKQKLWVQGDADQLESVFTHIIQNAKDATPRDGTIEVSVKHSEGFVLVLVLDSGKGMTDEFIKHQLYKPFESTKGLTGMGIGMYQTREYVRNMGGTIDVTSQPGVGSCFTLTLPIYSDSTAAA